MLIKRNNKHSGIADNNFIWIVAVLEIGDSGNIAMYL